MAEYLCTKKFQGLLRLPNKSPVPIQEPKLISPGRDNAHPRQPKVKQVCLNFRDTKGPAIFGVAAVTVIISIKRASFCWKRVKYFLLLTHFPSIALPSPVGRQPHRDEIGSDKSFSFSAKRSTKSCSPDSSADLIVLLRLLQHLSCLH